jgi:NADH-quinone oxidoreductase subunit F
MDVCDNIAPGVSWPPAQTTICVLGPSIPSSIASGIRMFRDEFLQHVKEGGCPHG